MSKSGVVKFFNDEKGFGFITQDDGGPDLFIHRNEVAGGGLIEGDAVRFEEQYDDRSGKQKATGVSGGSGEEGGRKGYGGKGYGGGGGGGYGGGGNGGGGFGGRAGGGYGGGFGGGKGAYGNGKDGGNRSGKGSGKGDPACKVYVSNLNFKTEDADIKGYMETAGEVVFAKVLVDQGKGRSKGAAVVEFASADAVPRAIQQLNESEFDGRRLGVREFY